MRRRTPCSTRTDPPFPYTPLVRSSDRAAVDVDAVLPPAELLADRKRLRGEGLIGFDQVEVGYGPAGFLERAAAGWDRAYAHDRGIDPGRRPALDAAQDGGAAFLRLFAAHQDERGGAIVEAGQIGRASCRERVCQAV